MTRPIIEVSELLAQREGFSLHVSMLGLRAGEIVGIVGPNGAGKSTLLETVAGIVRPSRGTVTVEGHDLFGLPRRIIARLVGYLPQEVHAAYPYSVRDAVLLGRYPFLNPWGRLSAEDHAAARRAMEQTDVTSLSCRRIDRLSGGELKRVLLASVLAQEPKALLLDEPLSGLDVRHSSTFAHVLQDLARQGVASLIATHDLNLASLYCHRLVLLEAGRVVALGTPAEVFMPEVLSRTYHGCVLTLPHPEETVPMVIPRRPIFKEGGEDVVT